MAPKRKNPPPPPPNPLPSSSSSSSDDDNNEEEDEEVIAASDQDDDVADQSKSEAPKNPNHPQPQSESESESEAEEDGPDGPDESDGSDSDSNPKPLASMPPAQLQPNPPAAQSPNNSNKKRLFQRLYTEDDEVVVLRGMLKFKEETGKDAMDELNEYYEYAKEAIHVPVTKEQFVHKVKRLKGRYDKNLKNGRGSFTNAHEQALYNVSKEIWGTDGANAGVKRKRGGVGVKRRMVQFEEVGKLCLREMVRSQEAVGVRISEEYLRRGLGLVGEEEKAELDKEWRELLVGEKEMHLKRVQLVGKVMKVTLTATKAS